MLSTFQLKNGTGLSFTKKGGNRILLCLLLLFFFLSPQLSNAQDSTNRITASWLKVKSHLQRRNDIANTLLGKLISSSKPAKKEYLNARSAVNELAAYIDTIQTPDARSSFVIYTKNNKTGSALGLSIAMLENDLKMKSSEEVQDLFMQLEASENRLHMAMRDFYLICKAAGRPELIFRSEGEDEAPKVRFERN